VSLVATRAAYRARVKCAGQVRGSRATVEGWWSGGVVGVVVVVVVVNEAGWLSEMCYVQEWLG
jgi:hypothetical protein